MQYQRTSGKDAEEALERLEYDYGDAGVEGYRIRYKIRTENNFKLLNQNNIEVKRIVFTFSELYFIFKT